MANIATNKPTDASSYVNPYGPAKAVDGVSAPLNRWLGSSPLPPSPNWLRVDLGASFWVNRWVVRQMGAIGWPPSYNLTDYRLQGSLDNASWFEMDTITNNSSNQTDRTIVAKKTRWIRVYVTNGLRCNTNFASIVDLEAYEAPNAPYLSGLVLQDKTVNIPLNPGFSSKTYNYNASVANSVQSITVTPTAAAGTIKVNGNVVASGQPSPAIQLNEGANTITVNVTSADGLMNETYTITVNRASAGAYLSNLLLKNNRGGAVTLDPNFQSTILSYAASVANTVPSVTVTPTATDQGGVITVNGIQVPSTQQSDPINLNVGSNTITIVVAFGSVHSTYAINVTRQSA